MHILSIEPFLVPRVVLLYTVASKRIFQKESEIGIEIKQRPAQESIGFEAVSGLQRPAIVKSRCAQAHSATIGRINIPKSRQFAGSNHIQRYLPGREKVIAAKVHLDAEGVRVAQITRVISRNIIPPVTQW